MTVLAGTWTAGRVAIAADSRMYACGWTSNHDRKLRRYGDTIIGLAGAGVWERWLDSSPSVLDDPDHLIQVHGMDGWADLAADSWLSWAKERAHGDREDHHWSVDGTWLVGHPEGGLRVIDGDGAVFGRGSVYLAVGSGGPIDMAHRRVGDPSLALAAARAAIAHAPGCGGQALVEISPGRSTAPPAIESTRGSWAHCEALAEAEAAAR